MKVYEGKSIFKGIAIGKIFFYQKGTQQVKRVKIDDVEAEKKRYEAANAKAIEQLEALHAKAVKEVGEANAAVFEVHMMMLEDDDYVSSIRNMIETQQVNAEFAIASTGDNFSEMFSQMDDEYFKARAADVKDISDRLIAVLSQRESVGDMGEEPVIVVADDLAPSETVQMDKEKLLAFVTRYGSANSHTAILARTMNIPALIGVEIEEEWNGHMAIVDGKNAKLYIDPDEETLEKLRTEQQKDIEARELLSLLKGKEDVTADGKHIKLYANIAGVADVANVLANDAAGIGLFRSEFLYLEAQDYPDEETQFLAYKRVAENMAGRKVVVRTLDIGADKQVDYFNLDKEENPATVANTNSQVVAENETKENNSVTNESTDTTSTTNTQPVASGNISDDWKDCEFILNNKAYKLYFPYSDLKNDGWTFDLADYGYANGYVMNPGNKVTGTINLENPNFDSTVRIGFINDSNSVKDITECNISGLLK